jgi:hypothetical protein
MFDDWHLFLAGAFVAKAGSPPALWYVALPQLM